MKLDVRARVEVRREPKARLAHGLAGVANAGIGALEELMFVCTVRRGLLDAGQCVDRRREVSLVDLRLSGEDDVVRLRVGWRRGRDFWGRL